MARELSAWEKALYRKPVKTKKHKYASAWKQKGFDFAERGRTDYDRYAGYSRGGYYADEYGDLDSYTDYLAATRSWIETMAAALAGSYKMTLQVGDNWTADPKARVLTYPPDQLEGVRRGDVLALLLHQINLTINAEPITADGLNKDDAQRLKVFMATLEDARISSHIVRTYAGGARLSRILAEQGKKAAEAYIDRAEKAARMAKESIITQSYESPARDIKAYRIEALKRKEQYQQDLRRLEIDKMQLARVLEISKDKDDELVKNYKDRQARSFTLVRGKRKEVAMYVYEARKTIRKIVRDQQKRQREAEILKKPYAERVAIAAQKYYYGFQLGLYDYMKPYTFNESDEIGLDVAQVMIEQEIGDTKSTGEAIAFYALHVLPLVAQLPVLHRNLRQQEQQENGQPQQGNPHGGGRSVIGGQLRKGEKEVKDARKESKELAKADKKAEADKRGVEEILQHNFRQSEAYQKMQRNRKSGGGYNTSPLEVGLSAIETWAYYVEPYWRQVLTAAAKVARRLDINMPRNPRGAYRRGPVLNTRVLYRHRLDDQKLFSRREVVSERSHAFSITTDLSGSTVVGYPNGEGRIVVDEMIAALTVAGEILERIGKGVEYALNAFSGSTIELKRMREPLRRAQSMTQARKRIGGGTAIERATSEVLEQLKESAALSKHGIVITDGEFSNYQLRSVIAPLLKRDKSMRLTYVVIADHQQKYMDAVKQDLYTAVSDVVGTEGESRARFRVVCLPTENVARLPEIITAAILADVYR